jgi:hypothetical protein
VPKLLIKFAGPNNSSPTVNKVGAAVQQPSPQEITDLVFKVVDPASPSTPSRSRSRAKNTEDVETLDCRESSRDSSRSGSGSSPENSDLDSPRKAGDKAGR